MKRFLSILIVFTMALTGYLGDTKTIEVNTSKEITVSDKGKDYSITDTQHERHSEATLNDSRSIFRLCNIRPQRLLPTHNSNSGKNIARSFALRRSQPKHLYFLYDGRRRLETAPFQSAASRDYYVLALRHILC
jgi:hypothetical protein